MEAFTNWVNTNATLAQCLTALLAALIALAAGALAYRGAIRQARAVTTAQEMQVAENARATAAALWAELGAIRTRVRLMFAFLVNLQYDSASTLPIHPLSTSVFDANLSTIGRLPIHAASSAVSTYMMIKQLHSEFQSILKSETGALAASLAAVIKRRLKALDSMVVSTMNDLRAAAALPQALDQVELPFIERAPFGTVDE